MGSNYFSISKYKKFRATWIMKKLLGIVLLSLLTIGYINSAQVNIYWVYEFYKISPQSNIFAVVG